MRKEVMVGTDIIFVGHLALFKGSLSVDTMNKNPFIWMILIISIHSINVPLKRVKGTTFFSTYKLIFVKPQVSRSSLSIEEHTGWYKAKSR